MAEEAVSLFKCFYEQGNPNGNHSQFLPAILFPDETSQKFLFFGFQPQSHTALQFKERGLEVNVLLKLKFFGVCNNGSQT